MLASMSDILKPIRTRERTVLSDSKYSCESMKKKEKENNKHLIRFHKQPFIFIYLSVITNAISREFNMKGCVKRV